MVVGVMGLRLVCRLFRVRVRVRVRRHRQELREVTRFTTLVVHLQLFNLYVSFLLLSSLLLLFSEAIANAPSSVSSSQRAPLPAPQQQQQQQQPPQPPYQFTSTIFGNKIYQPELAGSAPPGKASDPRIRR